MAGFTTVDVLIAVLIASALATLTLPQLARYLDRRQVLRARGEFSRLASEAGAAAVEREGLVFLRVLPGTDSVVVDTALGRPPLRARHFASGGIPVDVFAKEDRVLCYEPAGVVRAGCGDGGSLPDTVGFAHEADTAWAVITAMGQVGER